MNLHKKKCIPCDGGTLPLNEKEIQEYLKQVNENWEISNDNKWLSRKFSFSAKDGSISKGKDPFKEVMLFVNKVADVANKENHHPDMSVHYSKVVIKLTTHEIGGLSENDFIIAVKIDQF